MLLVPRQGLALIGGRGLRQLHLLGACRHRLTLRSRLGSRDVPLHRRALVGLRELAFVEADVVFRDYRDPLLLHVLSVYNSGAFRLGDV